MSFGAEHYFMSIVKKNLSLQLRTGVKKYAFQGGSLALSTAVVICMYSAGWRLAAYLVTEDRTTIGGVFRVFTCVIFTAQLVAYALDSAPSASQAYESGRKLLSLMSSSDESVDDEQRKLETLFGHIKSNNINFSYSSRPDVSVLQGLSVSVAPGETLALVGSSGGGKSTLISLIERFYSPTAGIITVDGVDIQSINLKWLRCQIGYVSQEPVLFDTSIADNIRYGALFRAVSDEEIVEVSKSCNIHEFIQSLPQGYSTVVGVGGTHLSGGQKQRIAIARALIRNPKILLLDEATSSLDAESEQAVQQTLKEARVGRTSIVVAHRLSTIQDADCIVVVQNGRVLESGKHDSLMSKRGAYFKLATTHVES